MMRRMLSIMFIGAVFALFSLGAQEPIRVELVITNLNYQTGRIQGSDSDALTVTRALEKVGFQVSRHTDLNQAELTRVVGEFISRVQPNSVAAVVLLGYGAQIQGQHYFLPTGESIQTEQHAREKGYSLQELFRRLRQARASKVIAFFDVNRPFPFLNMENPASRVFSNVPNSGGLETYMVLSTALGSAITEGYSGSAMSLFASQIAQQVVRPNTKITDVGEAISAGLSQATSGRQVPAITNSLKQEFILLNPSTAAEQAVNSHLQQLGQRQQMSQVAVSSIDNGRTRALESLNSTLQSERETESMRIRTENERRAAELTEFARAAGEAKRTYHEALVTRRTMAEESAQLRGEDLATRMRMYAETQKSIEGIQKLFDDREAQTTSDIDQAYQNHLRSWIVLQTKEIWETEEQFQRRIQEKSNQLDQARNQTREQVLEPIRRTRQEQLSPLLQAQQQLLSQIQSMRFLTGGEEIRVLAGSYDAQAKRLPITAKVKTVLFETGELHVEMDLSVSSRGAGDFLQWMHGFQAGLIGAVGEWGVNWVDGAWRVRLYSLEITLLNSSRPSRQVTFRHDFPFAIEVNNRGRLVKVGDGA